MSSDSQNIIFILSDQHNPNIIGTQDPYVRTPHLNRLAEQGTSLTNCYCPSPLCVPSRMAMLTGLLPSKTGIITNQQALNSDTVQRPVCRENPAVEASVSPSRRHSVDFSENSQNFPS